MRNRRSPFAGSGNVETSAAEPVQGGRRPAAGASPAKKGLWDTARTAYTTATLADVKGARSKLYVHVNNKLGQLSFSFRVLYSMPQVVLTSVITLMVIYTPAFYENLGASAHYISFFVAATHSLDLILDPFISYLSDSFHGPFGRRRPFIFVGSFLDSTCPSKTKSRCTSLKLFTKSFVIRIKDLYSGNTTLCFVKKQR